MNDIEKSMHSKPLKPYEPNKAQEHNQPHAALQPLTPQPFLPKKGNYRGLLVYQKAECIYDITYFLSIYNIYNIFIL